MELSTQAPGLLTIQTIYNAVNIANDISLVQTVHVITFNVNIQPIALGSNQIDGNVAVIVTGWGDTSRDASSSASTLQGLNTQTLTNSNCQTLLQPSARPFLFESKICTLTHSNQGVCNGDAGGPLTIGDSLVGVVSYIGFFNVPCARGLPDGYERVSFFRSWILEVIA